MSKDVVLDDLRKEMIPQEGSDFDELLKAIKGNCKKGTGYTKDLVARFYGVFSGDGEISLFIEGIDNVYHKEKGWRWEIYLNKDGTWHID